MSSAPPPRYPAAINHDDAMDDIHNASKSVAHSGQLVEFQSNTIAPSPPPSQQLNRNTSVDAAMEDSPSPLRIETTGSSPIPITPSAPQRESRQNNAGLSPPLGLGHKTSSTSLRAVSRTPSVKAAFAGYSSSFGGSHSNIPSPIITAMGDMTPLPSPLLSGDSPGPWKRLSGGSASPPTFRGRLKSVGEGSALVTSNGEPLEAAIASTSKRKLYGNLQEANNVPAAAGAVHEQQQSREPHHAKNRSASEYIPDPTITHKRPVIVSGSHINIGLANAAHEGQIRRELNFAESRGLTPTAIQPPTPPPSESSREHSDGSRSASGGPELFEARGNHDQKRRRWRSIGYLGQGTFSRVMLATSQISPPSNAQDESTDAESPVIKDRRARKKLVAIKVCEHGPRGGASEERIEMSLKRELEIMQNIHHPSLVNLKAWSIEPTRAILVLSYCPGGDLFDIATTHKKLLSPSLLRRIFAEVVGAVEYLHDRRIVHRDIKLENVLVNLTPPELADPAVDWTTFPNAIVTLADLGLSRRVADDEKLETRCGSDDYAAPEVIMGQPYDGRSTDAWSLGVLLYSLLESRLPFDPHPEMSDAHRMRSRTSHRIARVEWRWVEYAGDDSDHEGSEAKFEEKGLLGAMKITEGLLKRARSRWSVDKVASQPWVRDAIQVPGGLKFREEDDGEEVF